MNSRSKTVLVGAAVASAVMGMSGVAGAASGEGAAAHKKQPLEQKSVAPEGDPLAAVTRAYRSAYPQMTRHQAELAAAQQEVRKALYERLASDTRTYAGAWFNAPKGVVHVAATTPAAREHARRLAEQQGLRIRTHAATRSFAQLEAQAAALRTGKGGLAGVATGHVGINVKTNQVVAAVPRGEVSAFRQSPRAEVKVVARKQQTGVVADAGCTARNACDWTIRAGAMLWRTSAGNNVCSVGFTGRQTNNQRWVYTAGHCSNGNNVTWGTGGLPIGPMYASIDSGVYDASIIRVTNSWFASDQGGEIYKTVFVNGVAPTLSYITAGETVCLSANYTNPTGGNFCGVVGTNSDATVRGMVRVNGLDGCPGDSGGGWYWLTSTGRRIAYGLHSRSDTGCHGDQGGTRSWFSPLPTIKANWTPWLNVEVRP
jgi:streptogrisin C